MPSTEGSWATAIQQTWHRLAQAWSVLCKGFDGASGYNIMKVDSDGHVHVDVITGGGGGGGGTEYTEGVDPVAGGEGVLILGASAVDGTTARKLLVYEHGDDADILELLGQTPQGLLLMGTSSQGGSGTANPVVVSGGNLNVRVSQDTGAANEGSTWDSLGVGRRVLFVAYDAAPVAAVTEQDMAVAAMTLNRAQHVNLRDNAGVSLGGEVTASPAANTLLGRLKTISDAQLLSGSTVTTDTQISVSTAQDVLSANANRTFAQIQNNGSGFVRLREATGATTSSPTRLGPGQVASIRPGVGGKIYRGVVSVISESGGTNNVGVIEEE